MMKGELTKAYEDAQRREMRVVGDALGVVIRHFEAERDRMQLTKTSLGVKVVFSLCGGWELVGPWRTRSDEED